MTEAIQTRRSGNRCGHDPRRPRVDRVWIHPIEILARAQAYARRMYYDRRLLPWLRGARRSERMEACSLVLQALLRFTDLVTLRVLLPPDEKDPGDIAAGVPRIRIRAITGLRLSRIDRALDDLKDARILFGKQPREPRTVDQDGNPLTWRGYAAKRALSPSLWRAAGCPLYLEWLRKKVGRDRRRAAENWDPTPIKAVPPAAKVLARVKKVADAVPDAPPRPPAWRGDPRWMAIAVEIRRQRPELLGSDVAGLADRLFRERHPT